jgi:hypothetical protein
MSDERPAKRRRVADVTPTAPAFRPSDLEVSLYVRWHSASGKSKLTHLQLVQFDQLTDLEVRGAVVPWANDMRFPADRMFLMERKEALDHRALGVRNMHSRL